MMGGNDAIYSISRERVVYTYICLCESDESGLMLITWMARLLGGEGVQNLRPPIARRDRINLARQTNII